MVDGFIGDIWLPRMEIQGGSGHNNEGAGIIAYNPPNVTVHNMTFVRNNSMFWGIQPYSSNMTVSKADLGNGAIEPNGIVAKRNSNIYVHENYPLSGSVSNHVFRAFGLGRINWYSESVSASGSAVFGGDGIANDHTAKEIHSG
jgi:hypothetical protein